MLLRIVSIALGLVLAASTAQAQQEDYPNRAVHILAAAAPGGNPDVLARLLSQRLSEVLGKSFVVENIPGAGGVLAAKRIAGSSPDGYTLMVNDSGALAINITMNPDANYKLADFTPVTALATVPTALVIIPSVPANSLSEFIALAKSKPGVMNYGSAGPGSIHHLTMEIFAEQTGAARITNHSRYPAGVCAKIAAPLPPFKVQPVCRPSRQPDLPKRGKTKKIGMAENSEGRCVTWRRHIGSCTSR